MTKVQFILKCRSGGYGYGEYEYDSYGDYTEEYGQPFLDEYGGPYEDPYSTSYSDVYGDSYTNTYSGSFSSGLANSAAFIAAAFNDDPSKGIQAEVCFVPDNNYIDREVARFQPDVVIIEAYWVVPTKFAVLTAKYPRIRWVVRNHSEIPFIAQEGVAMDWSLKYPSFPNVYIASNSTRSFNDLSVLISSVYPSEATRVVYLPNVYPNVTVGTRSTKVEDNSLDVACFGAIRPLKNHLMQAVASIAFAQQLGKTLRFHVNDLVSGPNSNAILKNLTSLFSLIPNAQLVQHPWYPHDQFLSVLRSMDIGLQVSFSETFNVVSADMAYVGLPMVTSSEVVWAYYPIWADPTDCKSIISTMTNIWASRANKRSTDVLPLTQQGLNSYSSSSFNQWFLEINNLAMP
jgi:hypothetical protein